MMEAPIEDDKLLAIRDLPVGREMMRLNGETVMAYTYIDPTTNQSIQKIITKKMFIDLTGGFGGTPTLVKILSGEKGPFIQFTSVWVNDKYIISILFGKFYDGMDFDSIEWQVKSAYPKTLESSFEEARLLWVTGIDRGNRILFESDEPIARQIYNYKPPNTVTEKPPTYQTTLTSDIYDKLNANYKLADSMSLVDLEQLIKQTELAYYNEEDDSPDMLDDKVYDYVKEVYRVKAFDAGINIPKDTKLESVPEPKGRLVNLPVWMGSVENMEHGNGQLAIWKTKYQGPYVLSGKMDGASALYFNEDGIPKLYSKGRHGRAQDISELLNYLKLPILEPGIMVRGELIMPKSVFQSKYKRPDRRDKSDKTKYCNSRNAVGGLVNKIGSRAGGSKTSGTPLHDEFINDLQFIAFEAITNPPVKCSHQYEYLDYKFKLSPDSHGGVAPHIKMDDVSDPLLSQVYDKFLETFDYEMDGIVVCSDFQPYERPKDSSPKYIRAYKKPLANLTGVTTVRSIEWNVGRDMYITPVLIFDPIEFDGSSIGRATGHNARFIFDNKIGPGAVVEIVRSGGVIPKVVNVIQPGVELEYPKVGYKWNSSNVEFIFDGNDPESLKTIEVKKLHYFLAKIGAKGIGEKIVDKMYDMGVRTIPNLFQVQVEHIRSLGPKAAENVIKAIRTHTVDIPIEILAATSGCFGRGMGSKRFKAVFTAYPTLLFSEAVKTNNVAQLTDGISQIPGFADITARQMANGFAKFMVFLNELKLVGYDALAKLQQKIAAPVQQAQVNTAHKFSGKNILLTGFRDEDIVKFVNSVGGTMQTGLNKSTDILVIKDGSYRNKKTEAAEAKGVVIMTRDEFKASM